MYMYTETCINWKEGRQHLQSSVPGQGWIQVGGSALVLKHSPPQPRQHTGFNKYLAEQTALAPPLFSQDP